MAAINSVALTLVAIDRIRAAKARLPINSLLAAGITLEGVEIKPRYVNVIAYEGNVSMSMSR